MLLVEFRKSAEMGEAMSSDIISLEGFDPLATGDLEHDYSRIIQASQKRDILNILRSYTGTMDVFSESIQNALDAVDAKQREMKNFHPRINITIDLQNNLLRFVDNGIGMSPEQVKLFLRPNVSFKDGQNFRGHKGVGATFLAYGYTSFTVHTKCNGQFTSASINGGRQWAESTTDNIPRPRFSATKFDVLELDGESSGTCIEIVIGSHRDERPNFRWLGIDDPAIWLKVLRIRTALGGVYLKSGGIKPEYLMTVKNFTGKAEHAALAEGRADFYYPHEFGVSQRQKDISDIGAKVAELKLDRKEYPTKLPADYRNLDCIWNIWDKSQLLDSDGPFHDEFEDDQKNLIIQHDVHVYGCFVRSRTVWETFQSDELGVRPQFKVIQGGLQLASDYMIQGDLYTIPLTTAAGYQANSFIIVHFTNGNPDMGRKVFQPELKDIADLISRRVVAELRRYQVLLKPDTGAPTSNPSKELDDWRDDQRDWQRGNPLRLVIDAKEVALVSIPREEQDIIALFHELVGMNVIRGLRFYSTGYNTRYDGLFYYRYDKTHRFDSRENFWGVDPGKAPSESGSLVIEYKHSMDGLIRDFEKEEKNPREIALVVCWDLGTEYKKNYEVMSFLVGQEGGTREHYAATHAVYMGTGRSTKAFEVICLKDLVAYYQSPAETLAKQQVLFG
jgi:hypothetical protein